MRFREDAQLDTSDIQDRRSGGGLSGGRGLAVGGGGIGLVGLVVVVLVQLLGGGGDAASLAGTLSELGAGQTANDTELAQSCRTGADANDSVECAVAADIESIQDYWSQQFGSGYRPADTVFFSGSVRTGCGGATSGTGPFYCPADQLVYIDLSFFQDLQTEFGAEGGAFVDAYVLAHEYGHHAQDLMGTDRQVQPGETGPTSGSVRLELQADCYAGTWAKHAETVPDASGQPLIAAITDDDIARALDTAGRIGDDFIQQTLGGGTVDPTTFTHGTSAQRQHWFTTGWSTGDPKACATFTTDDLG